MSAQTGCSVLRLLASKVHNCNDVHVIVIISPHNSNYAPRERARLRGNGGDVWGRGCMIGWGVGGGLLPGSKSLQVNIRII